ncbi:MAG TPA: S-layer homology domain-containing protein [Thermoanaerobaculia bacterium]|nr:S-layer homology domain-containing protein [Thermoanaerobaculia bacterium]
MRSIRVAVALTLMAWAAAAAADDPGVVLRENFDAVAAPALPDRWIATTATDDGEPWRTDTIRHFSPPNAAHVGDPQVVGDLRLDSPPFVVHTTAAQLRFRHTFDFRIDEGIFQDDGGVLEISVNGQPFQDIVDAGGTYVLGGNLVVLGNDHNPLDGRHVFAGRSPAFPEFNQVVVNLPPVPGTVVLRWREGTSDRTPFAEPAGWWIDAVQVCDGFACDAIPQPAAVRVDASGNGVWEPGETVDVQPVYVNNGADALDLTGSITDVVFPGGTSVAVNDGAADYGSVPAGAAGACAVTNDCYRITADDGGTRPVQHWDEQVAETLSTGAVVTRALHLGGSFADVATANPFYAYVETVFHLGVSGGCPGGNYCPDNPALRKQMAVFLLKSKYGAAYQPPAAAGVFADVPVSDPFAPWIENLYALGITGGCSTSPLAYCPDQAVRRKQMAVFLLKTKEGANYVPPDCQGIFGDVACPGGFADWIEDLSNRQIAAGCGNGDFCPDNPNTRGQMAVFLTKTFGLVLYGP